MGRILVAFATLLILVLGAAFAVPAFVNWTDYRGTIDDAVSNAIGHKVRTSGDIKITLLPEPRAYFGKFSIETDGVSAKGPLLVAEGAEVAISSHALLSGKFEAETIRLARPELRLDLSREALAANTTSLAANTFAVPGGIQTLEISDGRLSVLADDLDAASPLILTRINGTLSSQAKGGPYRFAGKFANGTDNQIYDLKLSATSASGSAIKIAGTAARAGSKSNLMFDGSLLTGNTPAFHGNIATTLLSLPSNPAASPVGIQIKSIAKANFKTVALSDLIVTLDAQNRPQILTGAADFTFASQAASLTFNARSLDLDLLSPNMGKPDSGKSDIGKTEGGKTDGGKTEGGKTDGSARPATDWASLRQAADEILWLYPNWPLRVSLGAEQIQLRGEALANVRIDGQRSGGRWIFEQVQATLPGDAVLKVSGSVARVANLSRLTGVLSLEGQNFARLSRLIDPTASDLNRASRGAFKVNGSVALSDDATAFEGVTGTLNGNPFQASLRFEKAPQRKLSLTLSGDRFDLSEFDFSSPQGNAESFNAAGKAEVAKVTPVLGRYFGNLDAADLDLAVREVKTGTFTAQNLSARVLLNEDALTVSKLNIETREGLTVRGDGVLPLKGSAQATLQGRIDAGSAAALRQAVRLYGFDENTLTDSQAASLAPAEVTASFRGTSTEASTVLDAKGTFGETRFQGTGSFKGRIEDWKSGSLVAQLDATAADGNKLFAQLLPAGVSATPGRAAATVSLRLTGPMDKLETSLAVKAQLLQAKADGVTDVKGRATAFNGQGSATSAAPEAFLSPALLAILGGEARTSLTVEAALDIKENRMTAENLKGEAPKNAMSGRLTLDYSGELPNLEADVKMDRLSPGAFSGYFLSAPAEATVKAATSGLAGIDASEFWSNQPFSLSAFTNATAKIAITTKALKLSNDVTVSNVETQLELDDGRVEVKKLEGTAFGGEFNISGTLGVEDNLVGTTLKLTASEIDLAAIPGGNVPALMRGKASISILASGQGLSPRGLIAVLEGRGRINLSSGQIFKLSPPAIQKAADDILALPVPLTADAISKKILEASQAGDFEFRRFRIPVVLKDGTLEIRRASFRSPRDGTVRLEAYLELATMKLDSNWQIGVRSDRRAKWPPMKLVVAGPLRKLGGLTQSLSAEDFVRGILVRQMERDINRLEGLNKTVPSSTTSNWTTTTQSEAQTQGPRRSDANVPDQQPAFEDTPIKPLPRINPEAITIRPGFEARMRDVLQGQKLDPSAAGQDRVLGR